MINPKYIGIAACVGFVFSFFVGIFSGIGFGHIMLRALISALLFALLGAGALFLFRQFLSDTSDSGFDAPVSSRGTATGSGGLVNITIDDDSLADDAQELKFTVDDAHAMIAAEPVKKAPPPEKASAPAVETAPLPEAAGASPQVSPTETVEENAFKPLPLAAAAPVAEETVPAAPAAPVQTPSGNPELDELPDIGGFAPSAAKGGGEEVIRDSDFATGKEEEPVSIGIRPDAPAPVAQNAAVMAQAIQTLLAKEN